MLKKDIEQLKILLDVAEGDLYNNSQCYAKDIDTKRLRRLLSQAGKNSPPAVVGLHTLVKFAEWWEENIGDAGKGKYYYWGVRSKRKYTIKTLCKHYLAKG